MSKCAHYHQFNQDEPSEPPTEILRNLWIGGLEAPYDEEFMEGVDVVISALSHKRYPIGKIESALPSHVIAHLHVDLEDECNAPIELYFEAVASMIHCSLKAGNVVLLHCARGTSRSTTLVVYYLRRHGGFASVDQALTYVMMQRETARPNIGFIEKLKEAECMLSWH
jgi:protein-tyrosine phosphatase